MTDVTRVVTVDAYSYLGTFFYGYSSGTYVYGSISDDRIALSNGFLRTIDTVRYYENDAIPSISYSGPTIYLRINGGISDPNVGFDDLVINGTVYSRTNGTFAGAISYASWKWPAPTNPFPTNSGDKADVTFTNVTAIRDLEVTVGSKYYSATGYTYYGYDSGPNLFYGSIGSSVFTGLDGKEYVLHAVRWAAESPNNRVYLRLDHPDIYYGEPISNYIGVFTSMTIGSTTVTKNNVASAQTLDGAVLFYWNVASNPFGSVGSKTSVTFNGAGDGPYGLEVYNSFGDAVVKIDDDLMAFATSDSIQVASGATTPLIPVTGMTNTPQWLVILTSGSTFFGQAVYGVYATKTTGGFTITNGSSNNPASVGYWVVRLG